MNAAQNLQQRALSGPVLAHDRDDLPGSHIEADIIERAHAGEALADRLKRDCLLSVPQRRYRLASLL